MRPILIFILVIAAVFLTGALLSWPFYFCLSLLLDISYPQAVHFSILLTGMLPGIYYLHATRQLAGLLGRGRGFRVNLKSILVAFAAGAAILAGIELCLYLLGMRQADPDLGNGTLKFMRVIIKAGIVGCIVGLTEELLYRGVIFTGLARYCNRLPALIVTSLFYGAVHFIEFPPLPAGTAVNWLSGFSVLANAFHQFGNPRILDSLFALTLLGLLFGLLRWHSGTIIACAGLHAGIVAANKIFSYATDYRPDSPYACLVNSRDHQTGILAGLWLLLLCGCYYYFVMKKRHPHGPAIQLDD